MIPSKKRVKQYYALTKPGIIYSNILSAFAGYLFGAKGNASLQTLVALLLGVGLVIACGCVLNNILDVAIDKRMERTKKRALVTNVISKKSAYIYAIVLGVIGLWLLATYTNTLTVMCGLLGLLFYVVVYGYAKRTTVHSTLVGTISGALPPVAGYVAATNSLDVKALLLFLLLVTWQMPHFYAIAIRRLADYKAANLPVLPAVKGTKATVMQMKFYIVAYAVVVVLLSTLGDAGVVFGIVMIAVALRWLYIAFTNNSLKTIDWAKKVFLFSLIVLLASNVMLSVAYYLP